MNISGSAGGFYYNRRKTRLRNMTSMSRGKKSSKCPIIPSRGPKVSRDMRELYCQNPFSNGRSRKGLSLVNTSYYAQVPQSLSHIN